MSEATRNMHSRQRNTRARTVTIVVAGTLLVALTGLAIGWFAGQAVL